MKKENVVFLFSSLILTATAQTDSVPALPMDTVNKNSIHIIAPDNVSVVPETRVEKRVILREGPVYKLKPAIDIPITAAGSAWSIYALTKLYNKGNSTEAQILALNRND